MWLGPGAYSWATVGGVPNMAVTYLYHPGQTDDYGDNLRWNKAFQPGLKHHVKQLITMNTVTGGVGNADGVLQAWIDGTQVLDLHNLVYRNDPYVHVTHFDWSIFRGGGSSSWSGSQDDTVDVDNLVVTAQ